MHCHLSSLCFSSELILFTKRNFGFLPLPSVSDVYQCSFFLLLVYNKLFFFIFIFFNLKILHELKLGSLWADWMKPHLFIPSCFWAIGKTFTVTFVYLFKIYNSSQFLYFIGWYNFNSLMFLVFTPPFSFFFSWGKKKWNYVSDLSLKKFLICPLFILYSPVQLVFIFYVVHVCFMGLTFFFSLNLIYFGRSEQNH